MLAFLLIAVATFLYETATSMGKKSVSQRLETIHGFAFLSAFWGLVIMLGIIIFGPPVHFSADSLPTLLPRIVLEVTMAYIGAQAVVRAQRSTYGFLRLLSLPLVLMVDLMLGYAITLLQIAGILTLFFALAIALRHNKQGKKGAGLVVVWVLMGVAAVSLYKYNITHFNSVMVEQAIIMGCITAFFYFKMRQKQQSPLRLLIRPKTGAQAALSGLGIVLGSFAFALAPASVVTALKRAAALMWSVVFGQAYFHEGALRQKAYSYIVAVAGICLIASPYIL